MFGYFKVLMIALIITLLSRKSSNDKNFATNEEYIIVAPRNPYVKYLDKGIYASELQNQSLEFNMFKASIPF